MSTEPDRPRFLTELMRRKVFRAAALYGASAFVVLQAVDILAEGLALPEIVLRAVTVLLLAGFPVVLVLAWIYELRPEGGWRRTVSVEGEAGAVESGSRSRVWIALLLGLAGAVLLVVGTWLVVGRAPSDPDSGRALPWVERRPPPGAVVVAVLPFAVQGSPDVAYLGDGMVSLLSTKLDGAGDLRSVDARAVLQLAERESLAAGEPAAGQRLAEEFGAGLYVVGDLVEAGGRIQLGATLYDAERRSPVAGEVTVDGTEEEMFELVDDLTAQLLSGLAGGPAARVRRIAAVTTENLPALKAFLEGEEEFRRGQFARSVESFQRAIAADTTFALAYYRLSLVAEWNLQDQLSHEAAEQTQRYADRLSARDRRMLEAFLIRRRGDNLRAAEAYRSILGSWPDEMEAWLDLAEVQFHAYPLYGRSFTEARPSLQKVLAFDPDHSTALIHLARIAAFEQDSAALEELVQRFVALHPDPGRTLEVETLRAYGLGDPGRIAAVEARLEATDDLGVALAVWAASVFCRHLPGAITLARALSSPTRSAEARRLGHAWLASFAVAGGRWAEARTELAALARLSPGQALENEAMLSNLPFVPASREDLERLATGLQQLDPGSVETSDNPSIVFTAHDAVHPIIRDYQLGLLRARLGDGAAALRHAEAITAAPLPPTAGSLATDLGQSVRSAVLQSEGRLQEALAELETSRVDTWYGQTMSSALFARSHERFMRAELLFALGRFAEAEGWYAHLAELSPFEMPYLGVSYLRLAEIARRRGDANAEAGYRAAFDSLWAEADEGTRGRLLP